MRTTHLLGAAFGVGAAILCATARDARACGGCLHPPDENPSVVTDHRMIFSISSSKTTLYDQIRYSGAPSSFAWVLPISGQVTVGLSSDFVFAALDQLTQTDVVPPPAPYCPPPPYQYCPSDCHGYGGSSSDASAGGDSSVAQPPPVVVTTQQTVGPYETVQLHSTDPSALGNWLVSHGYAIPSDVQPIIDAYVAEGFDFLAMKLVPGAGVQSMRPVRVTMYGATTVLPLRMVAAGTGATVGVSLWLVGGGRYEPQNFPSFTIDPNELVWDWNTESTNYSVLRAQKEAALGGRGWQVESSVAGIIPRLETLVGQRPAALDYDPMVDADGGNETADAVRQDDLDALIGGTNASLARVTRLRSDLAHAALATDLIIQASQDQSALSNVMRVTAAVHTPVCPTYPDPPPCPPTPPPCPPPNYDGDGGYGSDGRGVTRPNGDTTESFSCATRPGDASPEALASLLVLAAVVGARMRRRRPR